MPDFARSIGADQVNFIGMELGAIDDREQKDKDMLDIKNRDMAYIDQVVDNLIRYKKETGRIDNSYDSLEALKHQARGMSLPVKCKAGFTSLYVDCFGRYYSCMAYMEDGQKTAGNWEKGKLKEFWYSKQYDAYREKYVNNCRACYWPCQNEMNYLFNERKFIPGLPTFDTKLIPAEEFNN